MGGRADERGGGAERAAGVRGGVGGARPHERRGGEPGCGCVLGLAVVGAAVDREAAVGVVVRAAAAGRCRAVDAERAAGRRGRVGRDVEAGSARGAAGVVGRGDVLGAVRRRRACVAVGARASGAGARPVGAERGAGRESVRSDPGVVVRRGGADVERPVRSVGLEVDACPRAGVVGAAGRVRRGQRRGARVGGVDLDGGGDRDRVADVVGTGQGVLVTTRREPALGGRADEGRRRREGAADVRGGVGGARAHERRGSKTRGRRALRLGVVGAAVDREAAVRVVDRRTAGRGSRPIDAQRPAGRRRRVVDDRGDVRGRLVVPVVLLCQRPLGGGRDSVRTRSPLIGGGRVARPGANRLERMCPAARGDRRVLHRRRARLRVRDRVGDRELAGDVAVVVEDPARARLVRSTGRADATDCR